MEEPAIRAPQANDIRVPLIYYSDHSELFILYHYASFHVHWGRANLIPKRLTQIKARFSQHTHLPLSCLITAQEAGSTLQVAIGLHSRENYERCG